MRGSPRSLTDRGTVARCSCCCCSAAVAAVAAVAALRARVRDRALAPVEARGALAGPVTRRRVYVHVRT